MFLANTEEEMMDPFSLPFRCLCARASPAAFGANGYDNHSDVMDSRKKNNATSPCEHFAEKNPYYVFVPIALGYRRSLIYRCIFRVPFEDLSWDMKQIASGSAGSCKSRIST